MTTSEQTKNHTEHAPISSVIPLKPSIRTELQLTPEINPDTKEKENLLERALGHRANLVPKDPEAEIDYDGRHAKTSFIYRRGIWSEKAKLVPESYGNMRDKIYQIPTRWLPKHPGAALSLLTRHGRWNLVTFAEPIKEGEVPKTLSKEEIRAIRQTMPPQRAA